MILTFVFLGLSVAVFIYMFTFQREALLGGMGSRAGAKKRNRGKRQNTKTIFEIKDISGQIIELEGNRHRLILQLGNVDYDLLSEEEQQVIENILMQASLSISFPIQFFVTTERVDTTKVMESVIQNTIIDETKPELMRIYAKNTVSFLNDLMKDRGVYVRRNYAVIECDGLTREKAEKELYRRAQTLMNNLSAAKITVNVVTSDGIIDILHRTLNKGSLVNTYSIQENGGFELYVTGQKGIREGVTDEAV